MAGFRIEGDTSGHVAEVDLGRNLKTTLPTASTPTYVGGAIMYSEMDAGSITGTPYLKAPRTSTDYALQVGVSTPLMNYTFNSTAQDTGQWKYVTATMTTTWATTGMTLNANSTNTTGTGTMVSTYDQISLIGNGGVHVEMSGAITSAPLANEVFEAGLFPFGAGTAAPTDGVYFRLTSAGLIGVMNFNGTETPTGILVAAGSITVNSNAKYALVINEREVEFWLNDQFLGELAVPSGQGQPFATSCLPISFQFRNSGTVTGTAMQVKITDLHADQLDVNTGKPWGHVLAGMGCMASQGQNGGTMGSTALYTNSLAPGAGTAMTNTTAAPGSGLGGQFSVLPTLTANTDGILCSYQNPAGGVNQTPKTLYITRVRIQGVVSTVLVGGPVIYAFSLAYGHTAVSMATAEAVAAKAPRRIALGWETYAAAAAVGTLGSSDAIDFDFGDAPIVVNPGEFIAICAKNVGTVTTSGVICELVTFAGYQE